MDLWLHGRASILLWQARILFNMLASIAEFENDFRTERKRLTDHTLFNTPEAGVVDCALTL